ncbi:hypothetical protein RV16_GL001330 [Enterococcus saccharolyticus]|nr:hypothetical protein RV16_GL001330 [Enterococcus saccharolyticus]
MVPLYTFALTTEEYGLVDLLTTSANLLFVVVSLGIGEATIRFIMKKNIENLELKQVVTVTLCINFLSTLVMLIIYLVLTMTIINSNLLGYFILLIVVQQFQVSLGQISRGYGKVKEYALNGIIMTIIIASLNIYLLGYLNLGIVGYLLSIILANVFSILYFSIVLKIISLINFKYLDIKLLVSMLKYSIPLIPNGIMWWLINGLTRFLILLFVGASGNGLFAVASKLPSILSLFTSVFQQAWQLSAFEEYDSDSRQEFYSKTFKIYYQFLFIISVAILVIVKEGIGLIVQSDFKQSWILIPALLLGAIYQSFSSFFGTANLAAMDTKKMFSSTVIGSIISGIANLVLLPTIGIMGAGIGTFLGFFVMWYLRAYNKTENFIIISKTNFIYNNLVFVVASIVIFTFNSLVASVINLILLCTLIILNREMVLQAVGILRKNERK